MSRKHYREAAEIIRQEISWQENTSVQQGVRERTCRNIAHGLADMFRADNCNFDRARFFTACGLPEYRV